MNSSKFSKVLRQKQTPTEQILWRRLRARQFFNLKFRRQYPIGPYVVDFYCDNLRLVIEVDGDIHDHQTQMAHDRKRNHYLYQLGLEVFRVTNNEAMINLDGILEELRVLTIALANRNRP